MYLSLLIFYYAVAYPVEFGRRHNILGPNPRISRMDTLNLGWKGRAGLKALADGGYETMDMVSVASRDLFLSCFHVLLDYLLQSSFYIYGVLESKKEL